MWKRVKRIGLLLMIGGLLVGGGALIVVQTSLFQQWLLRRIVERAGVAGCPISAERLEVDIWRLRASLDGIAYNDGKNTNVRVAHLFVDIPWDAFRGDVIRITRLEVDGVSLDLHAAEPAPSQASSGIPRIVFDALAIRNGSLTYSDSSTTVRIPSFAIEVENGRGRSRFDSPITISPDVLMELPELALQTSDPSLDFGPSTWRLRHPQVTVTGSSRGHVQWSPSLALNLDYSTNPFTYEMWRDLKSSAKISYENGVVRVSDLQVGAGAGMAVGSAEV